MSRVNWSDTPNVRITEAAAELLRQVNADDAAITFSTDRGTFELHTAGNAPLKVPGRTLETLTRAGLITKDAPRYVITARGRTLLSQLEP